MLVERDGRAANQVEREVGVESDATGVQRAVDEATGRTGKRTAKRGRDDVSDPHRLADGHVTGQDPLAGFSPNAARHLLRADGFPHVADVVVVVNSFFDPVTEERCAFEELISFHGGMGGPQTKPFVLHPVSLSAPEQPLVGAMAVHRVLCAWREQCNGRPFWPVREPDVHQAEEVPTP